MEKASQINENLKAVLTENGQFSFLFVKGNRGISKMKKNRWTAILTAVTLCFGLAFAGNGKMENVQAEERKTVTLYLTRHRKTMRNNTGRMQGWCDSPLTQDCTAVAEKFGQGLKKAGIFFDAAYSSDNGRAIVCSGIAVRRHLR